MSGASQQQSQRQIEELARQQKLRQDSRKSADSASRKQARREAQHHKIADHERAERNRKQKDNWLANMARAAQDTIQKQINSIRRTAGSPQQNLNQELEEQRRQQTAGTATKDASQQGRLDSLSSVQRAGLDQEEPKLSMEQKRAIRVKYIREQKQELKTSEIPEHVRMHQFLNQYRVVHGSGRPNVRSLTDQGLSLEEIKRIFEAYVISFFHELSLAAGYLVRAYTQWVKGGHREEGRAPIGMFGELVRQMQFARGPAGFEDDDAKKKKKLSLVGTSAGTAPQSQIAA